MRLILTSTGGLAALLVMTAMASAQTAPKTIYCLVQGGDASGRNCSYATAQECNANRAGTGGTCVAYRLPANYQQRNR